MSKKKPETFGFCPPCIYNALKLSKIMKKKQLRKFFKKHSAKGLARDFSDVITSNERVIEDMYNALVAARDELKRLSTTVKLSEGVYDHVNCFVADDKG